MRAQKVIESKFFPVLPDGQMVSSNLVIYNDEYLPNNTK